MAHRQYADGTSDRTPLRVGRRISRWDAGLVAAFPGWSAARRTLRLHDDAVGRHRDHPKTRSWSLADPGVEGADEMPHGHVVPQPRELAEAHFDESALVTDDGRDVDVSDGGRDDDGSRPEPQLGDQVRAQRDESLDDLGRDPLLA